MCVRGALALADVLHELPSQPLELLVVWEPVLPSDRGPPAPVLRARLTDPRIRRYWDPQLRVSQAIRNAHADEPRCLGDDEHPVWDTVFLFPPGAKWNGAPPRSQLCGRDVVDVIDQVRAALGGASD